MIGADGRTTTTNADGTVTSITEAPDPRFGMLSSFANSGYTRTPNGLELAFSATNFVGLNDPANPLSLVGATNIVSVNGRIS